MMAFGRYRGAIHACGFHPDLTSDKRNQFAIEESKCNVCRETDRYLRIQSNRDREFEAKLGDAPRPDVFRPGDGRITKIRPLSPLEAEARRPSSPSRGGPR